MDGGIGGPESLKIYEQESYAILSKKLADSAPQEGILMGGREHRVKLCIVGLGPAGIGTALTFSGSNLASHVLCLDAGDQPSNRSCLLIQNGECSKEIPCAIVGGFGGCSLLSAGKISGFPAGSGLVDILGSERLARVRLSEALSLLNDYLPLQKPNTTADNVRNAKRAFEKVGFEYRYYDSYLCDQEELREAYGEMFHELKNSGLSILLGTELIEVARAKDGFRLMIRRNHCKFTVFTEYLVFGLGRLGQKTLRTLNDELDLGGKGNCLDVGVRLEFPTDLYQDINKYHNDLKLLFNGARTFCVCKDGEVVAYRLEDSFFTEGHYNSKQKSGFTNLGILVRLEASKQNEAILNEIKERVSQISSSRPVYDNMIDYLSISEGEQASTECLSDFTSFCVQGDVNKCFPQSISAKIRESVYYWVSQFLPRDHWDQVSIYAPEVGHGGLVFPVNPDFSVIPKLHLVGDCTGRFRGILQAFCSGIVCAESIIGGENERSQQK